MLNMLSISLRAFEGGEKNGNPKGQRGRAREREKNDDKTLQKDCQKFLYLVGKHIGQSKSELIIDVCQNGHMSIYFDMKSLPKRKQRMMRTTNTPQCFAHVVQHSIHRNIVTSCNFGWSACSNIKTTPHIMSSIMSWGDAFTRHTHHTKSRHSFLLMLLLLSLFSSKTIFTSIIYILCSLMWKNNSLFFRFQCSLLISCLLLRTLAALSQQSLLFFLLHALCLCKTWICVGELDSSLFPAISIVASVQTPCSPFNCWFHSLSFCTFASANIIYFIDFDIWTTTDINNLLFN